ncbi:MAG TPA: guanylate kinase [Gemmatimonadaceae bacterium]|nr:guanylate kinase [Gemmatimonadaceae bacterium]
MNPFPVILSSPSGGGKTTIAKQLMKLRTDVGYSVSCTTRLPRSGEVDGRDYYFLSIGEMLAARERGEFAESAEVHGKMYGTLRREVDRVLGSGRHVLMDIDVQGARQFVKAFPRSVLVFVLPPSVEVLMTRLMARKSETHEALRIRLRSALNELQAIDEYDYVVVNDGLDHAVAAVSSIIDAETHRRDRKDGIGKQVKALVDELTREIDKRSGREG